VCTLILDMLNKMTNELDDPIRCWLGLFHGQHAIDTENEFVVERVLTSLAKTRQLHGTQRVDEFAMCRCGLLRLVEDRLDRFCRVSENGAGHCCSPNVCGDGWRGFGGVVC